MAEYIEREALKNRFAKRLVWLKKDIHDEYSLGLHDGCEYDTKLIDEIPTADVVPVVRCKDCKHCDPENYHCDHAMSTAAPLRRKPDDFCSYGEREEGADMAEYIERETFLKEIEERYCLPCKEEGKDYDGCRCRACWVDDMRGDVICAPAADVEKMSDGYHTFADLYEQRLILSAALAKNNPNAWKSKRHEDGSVPFGGGWFIMGFDTDEGCYTYHYELKDWDLFQCEELDKGKPWDGHTSKDVRRLLSIPASDVAPVVRCKDCKHYDMGVCLKIYSDGNAHPEAWQSRRPEDFCSYGERKDDEHEH